MNTLLSILGTSSILAGAVSSSYKLENKIASNCYSVVNGTKWNNVGLSHSVTTSTTGTDDEWNNSSKIYATAKLSWTNLVNKSKYLNANGLFYFGTYSNSKKYNNVELIKTSSSNNNNEITWKYEDSNDQWVFWAHQNCQIVLNVTASYNSEEQIISLMVSSYIYARTAGSVHSCTTLSQVDSIEFLIG